MMARNKRLIRLIWFLLPPLVILESCSPSRKAMIAPIREEGPEYLLGRMKEKELKFDWFSARFSAEYSVKGKKHSFNGQIRIRKDSLIWITLTPMLGIEALRLMISRDSVKMMNRINDNYFIGDYGYVNRFLDTSIDFDLLQAFLLGNDLKYYGDSGFTASIDRNEYKLATGERRMLKKFISSNEQDLKIFIQNLWLDPLSFKITRADVKEARRDNIKLESTYDEFKQVDNQLFAQEMTYTIRAENTIRVKAGFSKITLDVPMQFPFTVPASYQPVR